MEFKECIEKENSSESEIEDDCEFIFIELDGNVIERIEVPKAQKSISN